MKVVSVARGLEVLGGASGFDSLTETGPGPHASQSVVVVTTRQTPSALLAVDSRTLPDPSHAAPRIMSYEVCAQRSELKAATDASSLASHTSSWSSEYSRLTISLGVNLPIAFLMV